jgi:hypothetical protein
MDKKTKQGLIKFLGKYQKAITHGPLTDALSKLDKVVLAQETIPYLIESVERDPHLYKGRDVESAKKYLEFLQVTYLSGQTPHPQYVFLGGWVIERIHNDRWLNGEYKKKLGPVSKEMRKIKKLHGLKPDGRFLKGKFPKSYRKLDNLYRSIMNGYFHDALVEFGLQDIADLCKSNRTEYERLFIKGYHSIYCTDEPIVALREVVICYEKDARLAFSAKAYSAAVTLLGAAVEGLLLLRCLRSKKKSINVAKSLPGKRRPRDLEDPTKWTFDNLIEICSSAGWLAPIESSLVQYDSSSLAHFLRQMRNYVHPGRIIRERPWLEMSENDYKRAEAVYIALLSKIDKRRKASLPTMEELGNQARQNIK